MKPKPTYSIRLNCEQCLKFIDIDLSVDIYEKDQFGVDEKYKSDKLPEYLLRFLETFNQFFHNYTEGRRFNNNGSLHGVPPFRSLQVNPAKEDKKFFLCSACANLEKLIE